MPLISITGALKNIAAGAVDRKTQLVALHVIESVAALGALPDLSDACVVQLAGAIVVVHNTSIYSVHTGLINNIAAGPIAECKQPMLDAGIVNVLVQWLELNDKTAAQAGADHFIVNTY